MLKKHKCNPTLESELTLQTARENTNTNCVGAGELNTEQVELGFFAAPPRCCVTSCKQFRASWPGQPGSHSPCSVHILVGCFQGLASGEAPASTERPPSQGFAQELFHSARDSPHSSRAVSGCPTGAGLTPPLLESPKHSWGPFQPDAQGAWPLSELCPLTESEATLQQNTKYE